MDHGASPTVRPWHLRFRLLTATLSVFRDCWIASSSTELNRRMRTRMYGGVAGESGGPLPLCRFWRDHGVLNFSSISTWYPATNRLVSFAMPTTAISSLNMSSVMPLFLAPAVWEAMQ